MSNFTSRSVQKTLREILSSKAQESIKQAAVDFFDINKDLVIGTPRQNFRDIGDTLLKQNKSTTIEEMTYRIFSEMSHKERIEILNQNVKNLRKTNNRKIKQALLLQEIAKQTPKVIMLIAMFA